MKTPALAFIIAALLSAAASAAQPPPAYTPVRWNEDYSYLADAPSTDDPFDRVKYIPLWSDELYLSLGGQFRERYEYFSNNNFGAGPQDSDGYFLHRLLLHADLHLSQNFRVFLKGKASLIDHRDGGPRPTDSDEADVQQAFFDLRIPLPTGEKDSTTLRLGRQDLIYGAQRFISPLDWANVRRTFEGVKLSNAVGKQTIDAFLVRPVIVENEELNDGDGNTAFWGLYDTILLPGLIRKDDGSRLEIYSLGLHKTIGPGAAVDSDTYTVAVRFFTNPKPFDFDIEADYQFGKFGSGDISAYSLATEAGYTIAGCPIAPRTYLGFDIASGDDDPTDNDPETFNQLFPLGHAYLGYIDVIGRQNIIDLHPGVEVTLASEKRYAKKLTLRTDYHVFWRQSSDDAVYNAGGGVLRAAGGSNERFIGSEIDLLLNWQIDRHSLLYFGYSHFFAADFLEETGANDDIDFAYVAYVFTF